MVVLQLLQLALVMGVKLTQLLVSLPQLDG